MSDFPVVDIPLLIDGKTQSKGSQFAVFDPGRLSEKVATVVAADAAPVDRAVAAAGVHRTRTAIGMAEYTEDHAISVKK